VTTETLSVPDISCDHCQRTIETALGALPGVRATAHIRSHGASTRDTRTAVTGAPSP
jgi:copper chaperone CopZ